MRTALPLALLAALVAAAPASAQDAPAPTPQSTFVAPVHSGEAVRVTTYAARPADRGRLARRYRGLRANRTALRVPAVAPATVVEPVTRTPRAAFIQRNGSFFQVVPAR